MKLTDIEIRCLQTFNERRYQHPNRHWAHVCPSLVSAGLIDSQIFGIKIGYRTNDKGRAAIADAIRENANA